MQFKTETFHAVRLSSILASTADTDFTFQVRDAGCAWMTDDAVEFFMENVEAEGYTQYGEEVVDEVGPIQVPMFGGPVLVNRQQWVQSITRQTSHCLAVLAWTMHTGEQDVLPFVNHILRKLKGLDAAWVWIDTIEGSGEVL